VPLRRLRDGNPTVFVSLLRHALLRFSRRVSRRLLAAGHEVRAARLEADLSLAVAPRLTHMLCSGGSLRPKTTAGSWSAP
jgi:hypothetical protein